VVVGEGSGSWNGLKRKREKRSLGETTGNNNNNNDKSLNGIVYRSGEDDCIKRRSSQEWYS
jgi:hypothetical protein